MDPLKTKSGLNKIREDPGVVLYDRCLNLGQKTSPASVAILGQAKSDQVLLRDRRSFL